MLSKGSNGVKWYKSASKYSWVKQSKDLQERPMPNRVLKRLLKKYRIKVSNEPNT